MLLALIALLLSPELRPSLWPLIALICKTQICHKFVAVLAEQPCSSLSFLSTLSPAIAIWSRLPQWQLNCKFHLRGRVLPWIIGILRALQRRQRRHCIIIKIKTMLWGFQCLMWFTFGPLVSSSEVQFLLIFFLMMYRIFSLFFNRLAELLH